MKTILVTGANGFIGRSLIDRLAGEPGLRVRAALRRPGSGLPVAVEPFVAGDLAEPSCSLAEAVADCAAVVHLAARVHVLRDTAADPLSQFRCSNVEATLALARHAAAAGVRRFVFLSSIKVNGESTSVGRVFTAADACDPQDPYARSKYEAETGLRALAATSGMELVIVRPPLVYGPGVRANFAALLHAVSRGRPLPLGALENRRSLIALDNLVDLILLCLNHPAAAGQTFVAADGEDLSTPELVRRMARALGRNARLLPVPPALLLAGAALIGRRAAAERLCGNLQVDNRKVQESLGWQAPISVDEGLRHTVAGFAAAKRWP